MRCVIFLLLLSPFAVFGQLNFVDITNSLSIVNPKSADGWGSGVAASDFDGDGDIDLVLGSDISQSSQLLINQGDGKFNQQPFDLGFHSRAALWIDYDGDHLLDLMFFGDCLRAEGCKRTVAVYRQDNDGSFRETTRAIGINLEVDNQSTVFGGVAAADLNEDDYLDVLVVYVDRSSRLLLSQGDGTFEVVEDFFGQGVSRKNWSPLLYDMDLDGWVDYYQASDISVPNQYWSHKGDLNYIESAAQLGIASAAEDMGVALGDYDNDNDLDLYVSNIQLERFDRGNLLYRNDQGVYSDQSKSAGVELGGWAWGITFLDGNNDGLLDIASTNGWDTYGYDSSRFWLNSGNGTFENVSDKINFNDTLFATSLIAFDLERDGDLDLAQTLKPENHETGLRIIRNDLGKSGSQNYIVIQPRMRGSNHWAIGSLVRITSGGKSQIRPITAGMSYFAQEPAEAFFGLGSDTDIEKVEIIWPGGAVSSFENIESNQVIQLYDDEALHPPRQMQLNMDGDAVRVSWNSNSDTPTGFVVEKSNDDQFETSSKFQVSATDRSFLDTAVVVGQIYYYRVFSLKGEKISRSSIERRIQFNQVLEPPIDLNYQNISLTEIRLNWIDQSELEEGFVIQRSAASDFEQYLEFKVPENQETFSDSTLEPFGIYYYRVRAFDTYGLSEFSDAIEVVSRPLSTPVSEGFTIYPNPASTVIFVESDKERLPDARIITTKGEVVRSFEDRTRLSLDGLPPGVYHLEVRATEYIQYFKLIVEK